MRIQVATLGVGWHVDIESLECTLAYTYNDGPRAHRAGMTPRAISLDICYRSIRTPRSTLDRYPSYRSRGTRAAYSRNYLQTHDYSR